MTLMFSIPLILLVALTLCSFGCRGNETEKLNGGMMVKLLIVLFMGALVMGCNEPSDTGAGDTLLTDASAGDTLLTDASAGDTLLTDAGAGSGDVDAVATCPDPRFTGPNCETCTDADTGSDFCDICPDPTCPEGTSKVIDAGGRVCQSERMVLDGPKFGFHPTGLISTCGAYEEGIESGKWVYFDERGQAEYARCFLDGTLFWETLPCREGVSCDGSKAEYCFECSPGDAVNSVCGVDSCGEDQHLVSKDNNTADSWRYKYDEDGNLVSKEMRYDFTITYTYDAAGNLITETAIDYDHKDAICFVVRYTYDALGNLVTKEIDGETIGSLAVGGLCDWEADGIFEFTITYTYDSASNLITETVIDSEDTICFVVRYTYDAQGNLVTKELDGEEVTSLRCSGVDGILDVVITYTYDAAGNLITETEIDDNMGIHSVVRYTYDAQGNLVTKEMDGNRFWDGVVITYTYDAAGNLITETELHLWNAEHYITTYRYSCTLG